MKSLSYKERIMSSWEQKWPHFAAAFLAFITPWILWGMVFLTTKKEHSSMILFQLSLIVVPRSAFQVEPLLEIDKNGQQQGMSTELRSGLFADHVTGDSFHVLNCMARWIITVKNKSLNILLTIKDWEMCPILPYKIWH